MGIEENLSFSKEVAETLGLECAIILNLFKKNKLNEISSYENILESISNNIPFMNQNVIEESVNKLNKFRMVNIIKKYKKYFIKFSFCAKLDIKSNLNKIVITRII